MNKSIRKLYLFLALFFGFTINTIAQNVVQYQDRDVRPNSIVVVFDNTTIKAKGINTTPQQLAASLKNDFDVSVKSSVDNLNTEEWETTGDIAPLMSRLNKIPGVKAFPNYVFSRPDVQREKLVNNISAKQKVQTTDRDDKSVDYSGLAISNSANKFKGQAGLAVDVAQYELVNAVERNAVIYHETFDDSLSASAWSVSNYTDSTNWRRVENSPEGNYLFLAGDFDSMYKRNSWTKISSPKLDLSGLSSEYDYGLFLDHSSVIDTLNASLIFNIYASNSADESFYVDTLDITKMDGLYYRTHVNISEYVGYDEIWVEVSFRSNQETPIGFGAMFDDFVIAQYKIPPVNDPLYSLQYALENDGTFIDGALFGADISAVDAWEVNTGSDEVVVVVYDDGVDFSHPDLANNAWVNSGEDLNGDGQITPDEMNGIDDDNNGYVDDFYGWSAVYNDNSFLNPGSFHGTHVAGIIGAEGNNGIGVTGVAQDVSIISVMIFDEYGSTDAISIMRGYDYISSLLDNDVEITAINQSWGGGGSLINDSDKQFVSVMTDYALHHASYGALWVVSAGNDGSNRDDLNYYSYPNNIQSPNIITVANTNWADQLSASSDVGVRTVDVGAPGSLIASTYPNNQYFYLSGTSMASPQVTGAIALAKAAHPEESGLALATRVTAGNDIISSFVGTFGEGGRLNASEVVNPTQEGLIPSNGIAYFQRTFIDGVAYKSLGFVNNTDADVTVTGVNISGDEASKFTADFDNVVVPAGGSYGGTVTFDNLDLSGEFLATLSISTSGGTVDIPLNGRQQAFSVIEITPEVTDIGAVPQGTTVTASFDILNLGDKELQYGIGQTLYFTDIEATNTLSSINTFSPAPSFPYEKSEVSTEDLMDRITAQVFLQRGNDLKPKITYTPTAALEANGDDVIFFDDLNDASVTNDQWELYAEGSGEGEMSTWELLDMSDSSDVTDNVFIAGSLTEGYKNSTIAIASPPAFDFTALDEGDGPRDPVYLSFDYAAGLDVPNDNFFVNVISHGERIATLEGTEFRNLIADGYVYTATVDISSLAGIDDVEFWFIVNTDAEAVTGFGAIFDNVKVTVREQRWFASNTVGTVASGGSETVDLTIKTHLLPPGDFFLVTTVESDAANAFYDVAPQHTTYYQSRNTNLTIAVPEADLGEVNGDVPFGFAFDATNTGVFGIDYFANVYLTARNNIEMGFVESIPADRKSLSNVETEKAKSDFNLNDHKELILGSESALNVKSKVGSKSQLTRSQFSISSAESEAIFAEDFESGELPEGWIVNDGSYGLGHTWDAQNVGSEENPFNALFVGDPDNFMIYNNTLTAALSPLFDLSTIPNSEYPVLEFDYGFLLEAGYDIATVWLGVLGEDGSELYMLGSSEDVFNNDGYIYKTRIPLSQFTGATQVYLAFAVETDEYFESSFGLIDNVVISTDEKLTYIDPEMGVIDSAATETFSVNVNTQYLYPGDYSAITNIDYYSENSVFLNTGVQTTHFSIANQPPVAVNDTIAVLSGDVISLNSILGYIMSNDTDEYGQVYLEDFSDPLYGSLKYLSKDVGMVYVAPLNYDGTDIMGYSITDGQSSDTAIVYIAVLANPEFVKGSDQQYVFLEDNELVLNTVGMAAGVGGLDSDLHVWARPHSEDLSIEADPENHTLSLSATEDYFGQTSATLYVGHEGSPLDSMEVSIIVAPVNDAPVAGFTFENADGTVAFTDASTDFRDVSDGAVVAWSWDFGDGNTSDERNPAHHYSEIGTYDVTLTVTDNGGLAAESLQKVEVLKVVSNETVGEIPSTLELDQNYPNPFNPTTNIRFGLPSSGLVNLTVYNMLGQKVAELVNDNKAAGWHTIAFDASKLSSGIYFYKIQSGNYVKTNKMLLVK